MAEKHWVDRTHYREVSKDGRESYLYEADTSVLGSLLGTDRCVEVADHNPDGTTDAYEYDGSILGSLFHGGRGAHK
jgi:hypothetical protein